MLLPFFPLCRELFSWLSNLQLIGGGFSNGSNGCYWGFCAS